MKDDGGSAFPVHDIAAAMPRTTDELKQIARGMTLRDYFAAKAIPYLLELMTKADANGYEVDPSELGEAAYEMADAMIEARNK